MKIKLLIFNDDRLLQIWDFLKKVLHIIMDNTIFPYDVKWEQVQFQPAAKRIITFQDVTEY